MLYIMWLYHNKKIKLYLLIGKHLGIKNKSWKNKRPRQACLKDAGNIEDPPEKVTFQPEHFPRWRADGEQQNLWGTS